MVKQRTHHEATRSAIVKAASDLFERHGYPATSVDEIAAAAGMAKGAVSHHVASRERLFETVLQAATAALPHEDKRTAGTAPDIWEAIAVTTEAYFDLASTDTVAQIAAKDDPSVPGWERWPNQRGASRCGYAERSARGHSSGPDREPAGEPLAQRLLDAVTEVSVVCAASCDPAATGQSVGTMIGSRYMAKHFKVTITHAWFSYRGNRAAASFGNPLCVRGGRRFRTNID